VRRRAPRLIFVHIPKTGGTSLVAAIESQYGSKHVARLYLGGFGIPVDEFLQWSQRRLRRVRAVTGHYEFGLAAHLPDPSTYLTVLRDPVDRVVSHYHYVLTEPTLIELHEAHGSHASLEAHVARSPLRHLINNAQTRQLGGDVLDPGRPPTAADLSTAMRRIDEDFAVVGLQERLDESLALMRVVFGWDEHTLPHLNVTSARPSVTDLDPEIRGVVLEHNQLDAALYEHARDRFAHQLAEHGLDDA
jgi:galactose-3-O-sulfotransferase